MKKKIPSKYLKAYSYFVVRMSNYLRFKKLLTGYVVLLFQKRGSERTIYYTRTLTYSSHSGERDEKRRKIPRGMYFWALFMNYSLRLLMHKE